MRLLNKNKMYLIISQLCLALTGASFPENVFEDILFYLLQGQRKGRITLGHKVKDFHKMTPFQLCLLGFPRKYYSNGEYHTLNKIKKIFNSEGFIKTFFTHTEAGENHIITPAHISLKTWKGKDNPSLSERWGLGPSTREKNNVCLKIILYLTKGKVAQNSNVTYSLAIGMGLAQIFAIFPGISRAGITICTGLMLGYNQNTVARFSFFMAIPALLGAVIFEFNSLVLLAKDSFYVIAIGLFFSMMTGLLALKLLFKILQNKNLWIFSYYCLFIWIVICMVIYNG